MYMEHVTWQPLPNSFQSISQLEMLNVLIVLRLIATAWQHKSICVHIDNKAALFSSRKPLPDQYGSLLLVMTSLLILNMFRVQITIKQTCYQDYFNLWIALKKNLKIMFGGQLTVTCSTLTSWCKCELCCTFRFPSGETHFTSLPQNSSCSQTSNCIWLQLKVQALPSFHHVV